MDNNRPDLRLAKPSPWNDPRSYTAEPRPPLLERIAVTLQSPRFILFYLGFYSGCMATVGLAFVWARFAA